MAVWTLISLISTPGTIAPVGSVTFPVTVPVIVCANKTPAKMAGVNRVNAIVRMFLFVIFPSLWSI
jgi:hypothetical protein